MVVKMTQVGPEWQRCRIQKSGGEGDHINTQWSKGKGSPLAVSLVH